MYDRQFMIDNLDSDGSSERMSSLLRSNFRAGQIPREICFLRKYTHISLYVLLLLFLLYILFRRSFQLKCNSTRKFHITGFIVCSVACTRQIGDSVELWLGQATMDLCGPAVITWISLHDIQIRKGVDFIIKI